MQSLLSAEAGAAPTNVPSSDFEMMAEYEQPHSSSMTTDDEDLVDIQGAPSEQEMNNEEMTEEAMYKEADEAQEEVMDAEQNEYQEDDGTQDVDIVEVREEEEEEEEETVDVSEPDNTLQPSEEEEPVQVFHQEVTEANREKEANDGPTEVATPPAAVSSVADPAEVKESELDANEVQPTVYQAEDSDQKVEVVQVTLVDSTAANPSQEVDAEARAGDADQVTIDDVSNNSKEEDTHTQTADHAVAAGIEGSLESNEEAEPDADAVWLDNFGTEVEAEPVRLTFNGQSFALFARDPQSSSYDTWDDSARAVKPEQAPSIALTDGMFWESLDHLFRALRVEGALGEFLDGGSNSESELVLKFPDLDLSIGEDNVWSAEVTLASLVRVQRGLGLEHSLHVEVSEAVRWITKYRAMALEVASAEEKNDLEASATIAPSYNESSAKDGDAEEAVEQNEEQEGVSVVNEETGEEESAVEDAGESNALQAAEAVASNELTSSNQASTQATEADNLGSTSVNETIGGDKIAQTESPTYESEVQTAPTELGEDEEGEEEEEIVEYEESGAEEDPTLRGNKAEPTNNAVENEALDASDDLSTEYEQVETADKGSLGLDVPATNGYAESVGDTATETQEAHEGEEEVGQNPLSERSLQSNDVVGTHSVSGNSPNHRLERPSSASKRSFDEADYEQSIANENEPKKSKTS